MKFNPEKLKELRLKKEYSQERLMGELAKNNITVSRPTLDGWENGTSLPSADALAAMSLIFGISIKSFFVHETKRSVSLV
jgi:transcriptional regulator with XRE-family HTH domain